MNRMASASLRFAKLVAFGDAWPSANAEVKGLRFPKLVAFSDAWPSANAEVKGLRFPKLVAFGDAWPSANPEVKGLRFASPRRWCWPLAIRRRRRPGDQAHHTCPPNPHCPPSAGSAGNAGLYRVAGYLPAEPAEGGQGGSVSNGWSPSATSRRDQANTRPTPGQPRSEVKGLRFASPRRRRRPSWLLARRTRIARLRRVRRAMRVCIEWLVAFGDVPKGPGQHQKRSEGP
jgi:hypothetical protein